MRPVAASRSPDRAKQERERQRKLSCYEESLFSDGRILPAGIDEAGRGPLAGPVVAACVALPRGTVIEGLDDSKKVPPERRARLYEEILTRAAGVGIGIVGPGVIDRINIRRATFAAMRTALANLAAPADCLLVDGERIPGIPTPQTALIGGDARSISIAAASIVAKVTRDRILETLHRLHPRYGFNVHKGYPTPEHREALLRYGPCPQHRRTFLRWLEGRADPGSTGSSSELEPAGSESVRLEQAGLVPARLEMARLGEDSAAEALTAQGMLILTRNYRCRFGEVDIVALDGDDLVFVEVKARSSRTFGTPEEAITARKAHRLVKLARWFVAAERPAAGGIRFDVVLVELSRRVKGGEVFCTRLEHLRGALDFTHL
ncbi:MAG: ribonuclease HII [Firmicutes bacterium]|nr:ribonuclease HII [Bacillota bacterium]